MAERRGNTGGYYEVAVMPKSVEEIMRTAQNCDIGELFVLSWRARKEAIDRLRHARLRFTVGMLVEATVHGECHVGTIVQVGARTLRLADASGNLTTVPADVARCVDRIGDHDGEVRR